MSQKILKLGKSLSRNELKHIHGGGYGPCNTRKDCMGEGDTIGDWSCVYLSSYDHKMCVAN